MLINNSWNLKWLRKQILELNISSEFLCPEPLLASADFTVEESVAQRWRFQDNCIF